MIKTRLKILFTNIFMVEVIIRVADPDPGFAIRSDPDPVLFKLSRIQIRSEPLRFKIHFKLNFAVFIYQSDNISIDILTLMSKKKEFVNYWAGSRVFILESRSRSATLVIIDKFIPTECLYNAYNFLKECTKPRK